MKEQSVAVSVRVAADFWISEKIGQISQSWLNEAAPRRFLAFALSGTNRSFLISGRAGGGGDMIWKSNRFSGDPKRTGPPARQQVLASIVCKFFRAGFTPRKPLIDFRANRVFLDVLSPAVCCGVDGELQEFDQPSARCESGRTDQPVPRPGHLGQVWLPQYSGSGIARIDKKNTFLSLLTALPNG